MVMPATYTAVTMKGIPRWLRGVYEKGKKQGKWRTEVEMAQVLGFHAPTMNCWITGNRRPDPISCIRLARASGTPAETVLELAGHGEMSALFT